MFSKILLLLSVCCGLYCAHAAEYQWSVPVEAVTSSETKAAPRAWLWIPPACQQVRAVVVGQHNLLEETIFDNAIFRQACADNDIAIVWVSPAFDGNFRPDKGAGVVFEAMMKALAQQSGYGELAWAPSIPIGHSAMASYPYQFAAWNPQRTLVAISIKGWLPDPHAPADYEYDKARLNGVPLLFINGEYEDAEGRAKRAAAFRAQYPLSPFTMIADPGAGHFDFHDRLAQIMALYLRKVVHYRLPEKSPVSGLVPLQTIDPTKSGWLYDRFRRDEMPKAPPAPINDYAGPKNEAFWAFDEELADAVNAYALQYRGKKPQLLGYLENGDLLPQTNTHQQVNLKVTPQADGTTFQISGTFLDTVPGESGRPANWTGLPAGSPISHSPNGVPVDVEVTTGPLKKVGPDTFVIQFGRTGFDNPKRGGDVWFQATHDGDDQYKRAVQQALLKLPLKNTTGEAQTLTFAPIVDQKVGVSSLPLAATASSGLPVSYYVESGPAAIENGVLKFSSLPPRAKTPLPVTVVAYQWGRPVEPRLQSAAPVKRTFYLLGENQKAPDEAQLETEKAARAAIWAEAAQQLAALAPVAVAATPTNVVPINAAAPLKATDFGRAISFSFAKNLVMDDDDVAGDVTRVAHWNNLRDVKQGALTHAQNIVDSTGKPVSLRVSILGGTTAFGTNSFDDKSDASASDNDSRLFNGVYDQNEGTPTTISISGIPFARYDVVFYRADDGPQRAGKFQIGDQTLYLRGGHPNPDSNGANYARANDVTLGKGTDIEAGNVARFSNLSGADLTATFQAVFAGDKVQRNKVAGFQIVERK